MCLKNFPSFLSHPATLPYKTLKFRICSNISTDTMRSNFCLISNSVMLQVMIFILVSFLFLASLSIYSLCDPELDTAVILDFGYFFAIHSVNEPHPHPNSKIDWPLFKSACLQVMFKASISASFSDCVFSFQ